MDVCTGMFKRDKCDYIDDDDLFLFSFFIINLVRKLIVKQNTEQAVVDTSATPLCYFRQQTMIWPAKGRS